MKFPQDLDPPPDELIGPNFIFASLEEYQKKLAVIYPGMGLSPTTKPGSDNRIYLGPDYVVPSAQLMENGSVVPLVFCIDNYLGDGDKNPVSRRSTVAPGSALNRDLALDVALNRTIDGLVANADDGLPEGVNYRDMLLLSAYFPLTQDLPLSDFCVAEILGVEKNAVNACFKMFVDNNLFIQNSSGNYIMLPAVKDYCLGKASTIGEIAMEHLNYQAEFNSNASRLYTKVISYQLRIALRDSQQ